MFTIPHVFLSLSNRSLLINPLVSSVSGTAKYKKSAMGNTLSILSKVITFEQPSTVLPFLFTPITFAPSLLICLIMDPPKDPVPTATTVLPSIGLPIRETNSLFFWWVINLVIWFCSIKILIKPNSPAFLACTPLLLVKNKSSFIQSNGDKWLTPADMTWIHFKFGAMSFKLSVGNCQPNNTSEF